MCIIDETRFLRIARSLLLSLITLCSAVIARAQSGEAQAKTNSIQALLVTGGCCHDYDRQKLILTRGISARANVRWTVVQQGGKTTDTPIPLYDDPHWAEGFDIVVHNECFSNVKDLEFVDRILQPHKDGTPAILIHCAMHCYRVEDDRWFEFVGLQSPGHGPHYSYTAENLQPDHPIMADFGPMFVAPKGELYHSVKVFDSATPLAQANRQSDGEPQICVWTNDYHGTRVFGTTIGHYNETMAEPKYLDMMARGLLWAVGRDPEQDFTPSTAAIDEEIRALVTAPVQPVADNRLPQNCCGPGNVAYQKPVTAKSEQGGNFTRHLTDGRLDTRWCANGSQVDEWVTVDFEQPQYLKAIRLHWEKPNDIVYKYVVEASVDNETWKLLVDESENEEPGHVRTHEIDSDNIRYLRVTFLGASRGMWGSIWELEATADELPELSEVVPAAGGTTASIGDVQAPPGFNVTLFGTPPEVNYPVCLTAAATGEVFVGVDEQGSLGKEPGRGKVLRCIDTDGDGVADRINEFAKMDHPRGLIYDAGSLWVLHPPLLSVFHDTNGDGTADESEVLVEGISTEEVNRRGADHTTNGIRLGIDGWIYIAVGDFGFTNAVACDGTTLSRRGGGIVRIRPDGTGMEVFAWGLRNIVDVAVDPRMNIFTRDNTNDGGGWDIRLSHILETADYGYPSLFKNFSEEIMPPLADYGGGSGCGAMYFHDARWPDGFRDLLLTCDWGRNEVYSHSLPPNGATFDAQQDTFLTIPRPTDIDVDASGRMYVSSWKNGQFDYKGPDVGFVAQITPVDYVPKPVGDVARTSDETLVAELNHPSAAWRITVQREILRRAESGSAPFVDWLTSLSENPANMPEGRIAACYTLAQIPTTDSADALERLARLDDLREHAIRGLSDRIDSAESVPVDLLARSLRDEDPRIQTAALVAVSRLSRAMRADSDEDAGRIVPPRLILPLTVLDSPDKEMDSDDWRLPHPERVIPHLAVRALVEMNAVAHCLVALNSPYRDGALRALRMMHDPLTIDGLFQLLGSSRDESLRREIWTTLIRLYHREGEFTEESPRWWGTRPDTTGPYYDRQTWSESQRIADAVRVGLSEANESLAMHIQEQLARHVVRIEGVTETGVANVDEPDKPITVPQADPNNPNQIANLDFESLLSRMSETEGDVESGAEFFRAQSCAGCHTWANGQLPKGPHLVDIGKRYSTRELIESIVDPGKKIAQGFDTWTFLLEDGTVHTGFVVQESAEAVGIRQTNGLSQELLQNDIEERVKQEISMMPKGIVGNLTPEQLADLVAYLQSLH